MLKATGIVRKVDDLGRIVIPKELRRINGIECGDPIEIFVDDDGMIVLRKYDTSGILISKVNNLHEFCGTGEADLSIEQRIKIDHLLNEVKKVLEVKDEK